MARQLEKVYTWMRARTLRARTLRASEEAAEYVQPIRGSHGMT